MTSFEDLRRIVDSELRNLGPAPTPSSLYEPIRYLLDLGGKRIRPVVCLMATEMFGGKKEEALPAALAVEIFHNFSLIHDDIMDDAPLRRGEITVHEKWNVAQGILSGDAALVIAYMHLMRAPEPCRWEAFEIFNQTALEVCEGQQHDMDFELRMDVTHEEYLEMIRLKTSVLVGASLKLGALVAGASVENQRLIYDFGINLGLSFQLRDDYLDTFGDERIGKQIGGDILADKKTFLLIRAFEKAGPADTEELRSLVGATPLQASDKVNRVRSIMHKLKVDDDANDLSNHYFSKAMEDLEAIQLADGLKVHLRTMSHQLLGRNQ